MSGIQQCQPVVPGELSQPFLSLSISSSFGRVHISKDKKILYTTPDMNTEYEISRSTNVFYYPDHVKYIHNKTTLLYTVFLSLCNMFFDLIV